MKVASRRLPLAGAAVSMFTAVLLASGLLLTGCSSGPTAEELIRGDVEGAFTDLRDPESDTYRDFVESFNEGAGDMSAYGLDGDMVCDSLLEGFDHEITDVAVDEDEGTGTVEVTVTCKSLDDVMSLANDKVNEIANDPSTYTMTEGEINELVGGIMMEALDETEPREVDLSLDYTLDKDENEWNLDDSMSFELASMFM